MIQRVRLFFDIRAGEGRRLGVMAALLFLLIAANNLIKILRDSIFLGHHSVTELPYLYILVALCAAAIITGYTRYTAHLSLIKLILASNAVIIVMIGLFWLLLAYIDPAWSHYAFYIWSAIVTVIAVAQLWTLASQIFSPEQGKRLFGLLTAGGTLGGAGAGFGAQWTLHLSVDSNHFLLIVAGIYTTASLLIFVSRRHLEEPVPAAATARFSEIQSAPAESIFAHLMDSKYLKTIAGVILVSVIVSTLLDFELKVAAKAGYPSKSALAVFFSSYYGWLSVVTFFCQVILTGKTLSKLGLGMSLYVTPVVLLTGAIGIMMWPGLLAAALTRIADATMRNSIHRSGMEIIYMGVPAGIKKTVKTFLDVVIERVGDASAGFLILAVSLSSMAGFRSYVHFICLGLILIWIVLIGYLRGGYTEAMRQTVRLQDSRLPEGSAVTPRSRRSLWD